MDFLGLRNLTVIQNAVRFVEKDHNIKLDMHSIDYDDKKVLASIGQEIQKEFSSWKVAV